jgi:erythromycin esterase-like protein
MVRIPGGTEPVRNVGSLSASRNVLSVVLLPLFLLVLSGSGQPAAGAKPPPAGNPVEPGIWRVDGITPGSPTADLEPLRTLIGKAGVVGLGESFHTSGGYYVAKHRVFRFLVERAGFRALGIESPWAAADAVASYVQSCGGSLDEAMQGLLGEWQSAEVRDLVQWMCDWNRAHPKAKDRVHFFGFDIKQPESDGPGLLAFLARIGVGEGDPLSDGVLRCDGVGSPPAGGGAINAANHTACLEALDAIAAKFGRESKDIIRRTSKTDFEWAKVRLTSLRSSQVFNFFGRTDAVQADEARDFGMAAVVRGMQSLRLPKKTKVAVWGHNFHVSRAPMLDPNGLARTMGTFLAESLGAGYVAAALIGWEVAVDSPPGLCGPVRQPVASSVEANLHDLGGTLLVNPKVSSSALTAGEPTVVSGFEIVPGDHYVALLFLDESPKMTPLFRPPC